MNFTLLKTIPKHKLCIIIKFGEHKQEISEVLSLLWFQCEPTGDSTHVKMIISFQTLDNNCFSTDLQASQMWILSSWRLWGIGGTGAVTFLNTSHKKEI